MTTTDHRKAVIGIGNPLRGDDGAGIAVLELLSSLPDKGVRLIELGTGGINLVHELAGLDSAVIVDAAEFGGRPGEIKAFSPDDVKSLKTVGYSLHDWDLFTSIDISKRMGECPDNLRIVVVQPVELGPVEGLSAPVKDALKELARTVIEEVEKLN